MAATLTATAFAINGRNVLAPLPTRDCFLPMLAALSLAAIEQAAAVGGRGVLPLAFRRGRPAGEFPVETSAALMAYLRAYD